MTEYVSQEPLICEGCKTSPKKQADGTFSCRCPGKEWQLYEPGAIAGDAEMAALLKRKGFDLAPCGWYYHGSDNTLITLFSNGDWLLENAQTTIKSLEKYLLATPDWKSPTSA